MSDPASEQRDEEAKVVYDECHSFSGLSFPPSKRLDEELMPVADEHQIYSDELQGFSNPSTMHPDDELMPVADEQQICSDQLQGFPDPSAMHPGEELMPVADEHQICSDQLQGFSDPSEMHPGEELVLVDDRRQVCYDQLQGFSDPSEMHPSEELVLVDDKHGIFSNQLPDEELMLVDEMRKIVSDQTRGPLDPSAKALDGELMLADPVLEEDSQVKKVLNVDVKSLTTSEQDDVEIVSDQLQSFSRLLDPSTKPLDGELMLVDPVVEEGPQVKKVEIVSDQLHSFSNPLDPQTEPLDGELMLADPVVEESSQVKKEQPQGFSDPPLMHLDEELTLVDDMRQIVSDQLHDFSYPLDPPSKHLDEEFMLIDPMVEECYQVKKEEPQQHITSGSPAEMVLQEVYYGELDCFMKNEEMLALYANDNIKNGISDLSAPLSKDHDEELKLVDENCETVSDQLQILPEPSESSLRPVEELVGVMNLEDKESHPEVEEVSHVKEVLNVDVKPVTTLERDEAEIPPRLVDKAAEADDLDYYTFSLLNHRLAMILSKSHVYPKYYMIIPPKTSDLLPRSKVPVVLKSYGKIWTTSYNGQLKVKAFEVSGWRNFAVDNNLKVDDACFFELLENSPKKIVFKVIIVRTDSSESSPSHVEEVDGTSSQKPILLD